MYRLNCQMIVKYKKLALTKLLLKKDAYCGLADRKQSFLLCPTKG